MTKTQLGQHLNAFVSLVIILLMALALIASQAGTAAQELMHADRVLPVQFDGPPIANDASTRNETDADSRLLSIDRLIDDVVESMFYRDISSWFRGSTEVDLLHAR